MTSRERWILYPVLFLTLGIALRDKMAPRTVPLEADTIICNRLEVAGHRWGTDIRTEGVSRSGQIRFFGRSGVAAVLDADDLAKKQPTAKPPPVRVQLIPEKWIDRLDRLDRHWSMLEEWFEANCPPEQPVSQPGDDALPEPDA